MTGTDHDSRRSSVPSASDSTAPSERQQCAAIADSTGERCQRDALVPIPYCGDHKHLLDEVDRQRIGLKPPKSDA
jgi:hypothetical protein